jgi:chromosome segregation ATPase
MTNFHVRDDDRSISFQQLSKALDRPEALVRMGAKSLDIAEGGNEVSMGEALDLMRYFAGSKSEQDQLWSKQNSRLQSAKAREFECAMALEIVKRERTSLEHQVQLLSEQLKRADQRSDRLEQKLHDLTESLAHLVSQRDRLVGQTKSVSKTSIKQYRGKDVLVLEHPVNLHLLG